MRPPEREREFGADAPVPMGPVEGRGSDPPGFEGGAVPAAADPDDADAGAVAGADDGARAGNDGVGPVRRATDAIDGHAQFVGGDGVAAVVRDLDVRGVDPLDRPVGRRRRVVGGRVEVQREDAYRDDQRHRQHHPDEVQYPVAVLQHTRTFPLGHQEGADSPPPRRPRLSPPGDSTTVLGVADATYLLYLLARVVWTCARRRALLAGLALATVISAYVSYRVGSAPELYRRLSTYSDEIGIERPHLLVGDVGQPNAFAVGGGLGRSAVVLDRRLFGLLSLDELSAIVAHELAHVDHRDSMVQTFGFSALQTLSGPAPGCGRR